MNDSIEAARRKITTDTDFEEKSVPILNNSFDDTRRDIQAGPLMDHTSLTVTPRMRAVLTGDYALKVSRLYPDSPYILNISVDKPGHNYGFWLWTVTPTQEGTHLLWLIAEEVLENGEVTFIESVEIPIEVIVNPETGPVEAEEAVAEAEAAVEEAEAEVEEAEAEQAAENATETVPGFGSIFALTGLLAVAYLVLGRKH